MSSFDDARALALALPQTTEQDHHAMTSFRVTGKIFATVPDGDHLRLMLPEEAVPEVLAVAPGCTEPLHWGKRLSGVTVRLAGIDRDLLAELVTRAWVGKAPARLRPAFVLHDHRRPRPHLDLRLEEDGVLRSWALPRGLPTTPTQNRLAVAVPDHDLDHLDYQDEEKTVADTGWWALDDRNERRLVFTLHGRSRARRYALIRTEQGWLLHLTKDQPG